MVTEAVKTIRVPYYVVPGKTETIRVTFVVVPGKTETIKTWCFPLSVGKRKSAKRKSAKNEGRRK